MNLEYIKRKIKENLNVNHHFIYRGSRNLVDEFDGTIIKAFPSVFLIQKDDGSICSFSYSDFIMNNLQIIY